VYTKAYTIMAADGSSLTGRGVIIMWLLQDEVVIYAAIT